MLSANIMGWFSLTSLAEAFLAIENYTIPEYFVFNILRPDIKNLWGLGIYFGKTFP